MYKLTNYNSIVRLADSASIPLDPTNTDYAQYLVWMSEGNTPGPADVLPPPPIPDISPRQVRQALTATGLRASVEAAVASGSQDLKDWWEFSTAFSRNHPEVVAMGAALNQTSGQLDALWALGTSL